MDDKFFKVGIYLRLSREDELSDESQSISNQRDYIMNYVRNNNLEIIDEYVDDGVSGTLFDREGWKKLISDIDNGRINMVITKDSSRLGRNVSQSLYYITEYFQDKNIRYVALTDEIDTFNKNYNSDMVMFKAFYNEIFIKDISTKIKATLNSQKKIGKFMGGNAPYGYDRNLPNNKHELVINEEQAKIVKKIYSLCISGIGVKKIANILTDEGIPIPSVQKKLNRGNKSSVFGIWQERTIKDILTNPTYKGDLTQCREYKVSYKSKKRRKNKKNNWIIAEKACPSIIEENVFNLVQDMYSKNKNRSKKSKEYLLRGFLICNECGHTISIGQVKWMCKGEEKSKNICYCNYYKKFSRYNVCSPHKIDYDELEKKVLIDIKNKFKNNLSKKKLENILKSNDNMLKIEKDLKKDLTIIKRNILLQEKYVDSIYKDKLKGLINEEMFKRSYNNLEVETANLKKERKRINNELKSLNKKIASKQNNEYSTIIDDYLFKNRPSKQLIATLIDKISIDEHQNINIYYKIRLF